MSRAPRRINDLRKSTENGRSGFYYMRNLATDKGVSGGESAREAVSNQELKNTTKNYLRRIRLGRERVRALKATAKEYRQNISWLRCVDYARDRVDHSKGSPTEAAALDAISRIEDVEAETLRYSAEIEEVEAQILGMKDLIHQAVLFGIYAEGRSLEDVANRAGYSYNYMSAIHGEALRAFMNQYGDAVAAAEE